MLFRLAVLGHRSSISDIRKIVSEKFDSVEVYGITLSNDEDVEEAERELTAILPKCDGVLYTRRDPYRLMAERVNYGEIPVRYVDIDASCFIHGLLEASYHFQTDICHVSVDTLDSKTVMQAYESIGIGREQLELRFVSVDTSAEHFVQNVIQTHCENHANRRCGVCVTNIRSAYDELCKKGIPAVLMAPTRDTYIYEIRHLLAHRQLRRIDEGGSAILKINTAVANEQYLSQRTLVQEVLDQNTVRELVAYYAQRLSGAFLSGEEGSYVLLCDYDKLYEETSGFTRIDLLSSVYLNTPYTLRVGIGVAKTPRLALINAELGVQRAGNEGGNKAYVIFTPERIIGPIEPNELTLSNEGLFDARIARVAGTCGLAAGSVMRIDHFVRKKNNRSFTVSELGEELGVSGRTAARIVDKLEMNGYAVEIGKATTGERGRPTRVFRLMI